MKNAKEIPVPKIILNSNSFVPAEMLGFNKAKTIGHAMIFTSKGNDYDKILLFCNDSQEPAWVGDQGINEGVLNCKKCIDKLKRFVSQND